uniref:Uncharacterized protein n=1 Tax=Heliothis virescens TaxID=7102 RepID=A0A2A4J6L1_HELVI
MAGLKIVSTLALLSVVSAGHLGHLQAPGYNAFGANAYTVSKHPEKIKEHKYYCCIVSTLALLSVVSAGHLATCRPLATTRSVLTHTQPDQLLPTPVATDTHPILRYENVNNGDGTYKNNYETGNGISAHESGAPRAPGPQGLAVTAEGGFSYRAPDGQQVSLTYTADENGFHPVGSHIPTPPPIPEAILRSIEFNRQHPSSGDGSYNGRYNHGYNY